MQTSYSQTMSASFEGMLADAGFKYTESKAAVGTIPFGRGVTSGDGETNSARLPRRNSSTIVFSADLVTSNTINGSVNGTAIAEVTFSTNHLTTMNLIKAEIETVLTALGLTGTVTVGGASNRTITVVVNDTSLLFASWVVAAGASQATVTHVYGTSNFFRGVALHTHKMPNSDGTVSYQDGESVSILRKGRVHVKVNAAVSENDDAYVNLATDTEEGMFTNVSTGNIGPVGKFVKGASDNGIAVLEINLP